MNDKVRAKLVELAESYGNDVYDGTDQSLYDVLICQEALWRGHEELRRWWIEYSYVAIVDGMYICYPGAQSTGDMSAQERGYEPNLNLIFEVAPVEVTVIEYEPVDD